MSERGIVGLRRHVEDRASSISLPLHLPFSAAGQRCRGKAHRAPACVSHISNQDREDREDQDRENRGEHERWKREYDNKIESSPLARLKGMLGKLLKLGIVGDDAASLFV